MNFYNGHPPSTLAVIEVKRFIASLGILLITLIARRFIASRVMSALVRLAGKTAKTWDTEAVEALRPVLGLFILLAGIWASIRILPLPEKPFHFHAGANIAAQIAIILLTGWMLFRMITVLTNELGRKAQDPAYWLDPHLVPGASIALKTAAGLGLLVAFIDALGYSVSAIVASLGIGGIAVALAAKDTLANFFGSVTVMVDKPFRIGELIKGEDFEGTVEEIGFRSTKIRTPEKTVKVVPNEKFASMIIENMDRRTDAGINMRRVNFTIHVERHATAARIERAVNALRALLRSNPDVNPDLTEVHFAEFGESSLAIAVNYFITTAVPQRYLQIRQEINLAMMRELEKQDLRLALPLRAVLLENPGGEGGK